MVWSAFEYFATFVLENGEEIEYQIGQEWYEKIGKEQTGTLVVVNGNFLVLAMVNTLNKSQKLSRK